MEERTVGLIVPEEAVDALAERVIARVRSMRAAWEEPWVGAEDAAEHLACARQRIYDLVYQREHTRIPFRKDGDRLLFRRSELDDWLEAGGSGGLKAVA
jgi:excisionase family DNA binding protein